MGVARSVLEFGIEPTEPNAPLRVWAYPAPTPDDCHRVVAVHYWPAPECCWKEVVSEPDTRDYPADCVPVPEPGLFVALAVCAAALALFAFLGPHSR